MEAYIYKITNNINQKIYIGQSKQSVKKKIKDFKGDANRYNYGVYAAIKEFGFENFSFNIIEECSISTLNDREIYWISIFKATNKNIGYNISGGGQGKNRITSEETKRKIADLQRGKKYPKRTFTEKHKANMRKPKNLSPEQKEKISKLRSLERKGKKFSEAHKANISESKKKCVLQYDLEGNFIKEWGSIMEAATNLNANMGCISECANGNQKTSKGYVWKFKI